MDRLTPLLRRLEVRQEKGDGDENTHANFDTAPLPPERRTFGPWEFVTLWVITGSFNIGGWTTGSSLIALGLNVWQCMITVIVGNILVGVFCVLSGAPGAKYHIGFPVIQRSSWGVKGYIFVVVQRVFLACIWFSTQVYWGGQCTRVFLTALFPSFANLNRPLANGTMTTGDFTSFILFTLLYLPLIFIRPEHYRIPFLISCALVVPTIFALLIYFLATTGSAGSFISDVSSITTPATGARLGWMLLLGICTNISSISVHIYVQSDYTRYARKPSDQILAQLVMVPLGTILVALVGIICTSCAATLYPETTGRLLWEPYNLLSALQTHHNNSHRSRAAVAFSSLAFAVAQFGMVVANNGLSAGMDLSALFPRFFTIRRGMLLMSALAFVVQPWQLLNGASKFLNVLGGYGVFLGPMTGVMFADYFLLRDRKVKLTDLYKSHPRGLYWFRKGVNWRAFVAWVGGVWVTLPGFVQRVRDPTTDLAGWSRMYYMAWPLGTALSLVWFLSLNRVWKVHGVGVEDDRDYFGTFGPRVVDGVVVEEGSRKDSEDGIEKSTMEVRVI
ncbi:Thiamine transporter isoform D [Sphaceloma murrayae]|uniref:Thiamine transporter isoform D n=1 Tax=Sphaceloma murrayae TaxID=2082308 RepID=A0A2K1QH02_9PEZI|nr:Thiamine transporter isoform D [Sphaceloma murrayae]